MPTNIIVYTDVGDSIWHQYRILSQKKLGLIKLKSSYLEEKTDFTFYEILTRVSGYFEEVDSDFDGQITFNEFITKIPTMLEIHHRSGLSRHMHFSQEYHVVHTRPVRTSKLDRTFAGLSTGPSGAQLKT